MTDGNFVARYMRGYTSPWWVYDLDGGMDRLEQGYRTQERAQRYADLRNAGVRREVAMSAVGNGVEVIRLGDLVFVDVFRAGLLPAKVVMLGRVRVPGALNNADTQIEVSVKLTAARPGYKSGEVLTMTGHPEIDKVVPRKSVRIKDGQYRIRSGVFDA